MSGTQQAGTNNAQFIDTYNESYSERHNRAQQEQQRRFDEDIANTEKFQRQTYSAIGGTPLKYLGASPTADGGMEIDFAELCMVKGTVVMTREQALSFMRGIQNWFDMGE